MSMQLDPHALLEIPYLGDALRSVGEYTGLIEPDKKQAEAKSESVPPAASGDADFFVSDPETGESIPDATSEFLASGATLPAPSPALSEKSFFDSVVEAAKTLPGQAVVRGVARAAGLGTVVDAYDAYTTVEKVIGWVEESQVPESEQEPGESESDDGGMCLVAPVLVDGYYDVTTPDGIGQCFESEQDAQDAVVAWQWSQEIYATSETADLPAPPMRQPEETHARSNQNQASTPPLALTSEPQSVAPAATASASYFYSASAPVVVSTNASSASVSANDETGTEAPVLLAGTDPIVASPTSNPAVLENAAQTNAPAPQSEAATVSRSAQEQDTSVHALAVTTDQAQVTSTSGEGAENVSGGIPENSSNGFAPAFTMQDENDRAGDGHENVTGQVAGHACMDQQAGCVVEEMPSQSVSESPSRAELEVTGKGSTTNASPEAVIQPQQKAALEGVSEDSGFIGMTGSEAAHSRRLVEDDDDTVSGGADYSAWLAAMLASSVELQQGSAQAREGAGQPVVYIPGGAVAAMSAGNYAGALRVLLDLTLVQADVARPVTVVADRGGQDSNQRDREGAHPDQATWMAENARLSGQANPVRTNNTSVRTPPARPYLPRPADTYVTGVVDSTA